MPGLGQKIRGIKERKAKELEYLKSEIKKYEAIR